MEIRCKDACGLVDVTWDNIRHLENDIFYYDCLHDMIIGKVYTIRR